MVVDDFFPAHVTSQILHVLYRPHQQREVFLRARDARPTFVIRGIATRREYQCGAAGNAFVSLQHYSGYLLHMDSVVILCPGVARLVQRLGCESEIPGSRPVG